jgi:hypothetical protein
MVRKLKHHEQKLLRKVDFTTYKSDHDHRDAAVIRRYAIQKPSDYSKYNSLCGVWLLLTHSNSSSLPPLIQSDCDYMHVLTRAVTVFKAARTPTSRSPSNILLPTDPRGAPASQVARYGHSTLDRKRQALRSREIRIRLRVLSPPTTRRDD